MMRMLSRRSSLVMSVCLCICVLSVSSFAFARAHTTAGKSRRVAVAHPRPALSMSPTPRRTASRRPTARAYVYHAVAASHSPTLDVTTAPTATAVPRPTTATATVPPPSPVPIATAHVSDAASQARVAKKVPRTGTRSPAGLAGRPAHNHARQSRRSGHQVHDVAHQTQPIAARVAGAGDLSLHAVGTQLYTAWNTPITLKAINWYGFEYAPFVPDGLNRVPLDFILGTIRRLGFNAIRLTFADQTIRSDPIVLQGLDANSQLRGMRALQIMARIVARAHVAGIRVILCNSRSEAGMGPETASGLWYTPAYPEWMWQSDWERLTALLRGDSAFVGADLRNEPHQVGGGTVNEQTYAQSGPMWGPYRGRSYPGRDWRSAAERMGNNLLRINPHLLVIVEGVQLFADTSIGKVTGGLWGSNLGGVRQAPIRLIHPGQLVYSVHEYGPQMWQGNWFKPTTTYASLSRRWTKLWGYLLSASRSLQAPIFVGEFGTCHNYHACISDSKGWKEGFWFASFVRYLHAHPRVGWAYWSLNPQGPFHRQDVNFYSLMSRDWRHYYPLVTRGMAPLLAEPSGMRGILARPGPAAFAPVPGCTVSNSCVSRARPSPEFPVNVTRDVPYVQPADSSRSGDLYLPETVGAARPAVVIVHGGSWDNGRKGTSGTTVLAESMARHGYVAFDINYRLAGQGGEYPKNIRDVDDAVAYLATRRYALRIDPSKIGVVGVSTGGYLALMAAYRSGISPFLAPHYPGVSVRIRAVGTFFAPVELKATVRTAGNIPRVDKLATYMGTTFDADRARYRMASPLRYALSAVPTIQWYAPSDPLTPMQQTFELFKRLKQREVQSQLLDLPGMPRHFTELSPPAQNTALAQLRAFFDDVLGYHPRR